MGSRKKKKGLSKRKGSLNGLKLTIENDKGKASKYFVPVKKQSAASYSGYSYEQASSTNRQKLWKIADNNINASEILIGKEIVLKRGSARIAGTVLDVSCLCKPPSKPPSKSSCETSGKSPEGGTVIPPPPR